MQKQGEIFLILSRRSGKQGKEIAEAMGIDPSYLSRSYQKATLPKSLREKACAFFGVEMSTFDQSEIRLESVGLTDDAAADNERGAIDWKQEAERLEQENALLRERVDALLDVIVGKQKK